MNTVELVKGFEPEALFNLIWSEKSETIARIILCMDFNKRHEIFNRLTLNAQISVIYTIAKTKEIIPRELKQIDELLTKQPSVSEYENGFAKGGIEAAVEILNLSHRDNFLKIIETFEETKPELADEILKKMLVFEDIVLLGNDFLKKAFLEVDNHDLAIALKGVDKAIQEGPVFSNITKKREKIIKNEMDYLGPMRLEDVEEAQFKIAKFIRKLVRTEKKNSQADINFSGDVFTDIQIFLRDKNINMVNVWSEEFKDYLNVKVSCGDIFEIKADAIISPANSFGFMDGGIDLRYSEYFGWDLQKALQNKIRCDFYGELPVGLAVVIKTGNDDIKYLISCPTMRVPEDVSDTVNAYLAFRAGLIEAINFNKNNSDKIKSILCPGLGTLTGMLPETNCAKQMKYAFDSVFNGVNNFPNDLWAARDLHVNLKKK